MDIGHGVLVLLLLCAAAACLRAAYGPFSSGATKVPWRLASALAFCLNVVLVSLPGRFDSDPESAMRMPTLLAPAPWAFVIWAVIYMGELIGLAWWFLCGRSEPTRSIEKSSLAWCAANVAQSLWCCAFRPWAQDKLWLSALLLGAIAACLFPAQVQVKNVQSSGAFWTVVLPRSLHLGWTTAATLVNVNSYVSACFGPIVAMCVAVFSVALATFVGIAYTWSGLPSAAGAVAWALCALGSGAPSGENVTRLGAGAMWALKRSEFAASILLCLAISFRAAEGWKQEEKSATGMYQPLLLRSVTEPLHGA